MHRRFERASLIFAAILCAAAVSFAADPAATPVVVTAPAQAAPSATAPAEAVPAAPTVTQAAQPPAPAVQPPSLPTPPGPSAPVSPATPPAASAEPALKLDQPLPPFQLAQPPLRIGFVDIAKIERESKQGKAAQSKVKAKKDKFQSQITAKQKQLEKQKADIEAKLPTMPPDERAAKAKEFEKKVEDYRKFVQKADTEMKPLVEEVTRGLAKSAQDAATAYGKANGLPLIVTLKEILYMGSGVIPEDVTDGVLKLMNEAQKGK